MDAAEWEPVRKQFADRGLQRVLVTLGAHGSVVLDSQAADTQQITRIPSTKVVAVDTTGAGDAFTGAVAARLAAGASLAEAAAFASVAAALAATKKGTQTAYPDAAEVGLLRSGDTRRS
jgi:ribokinase